MASLREELVAIDAFYKSCLDKIPSAAYFSRPFSAKGHVDDDSLTTSQKKALQKRKRLNPSNMQTTSEMLQNVSISDEDDDDEDEEQPVAEAWKVEKLKPQQSASLQELHHKLQAKLDEIKAKRGSKKRTPEEQLEIQKRRKLERARYKEKKKRLSNAAKLVKMNGTSTPDTKPSASNTNDSQNNKNDTKMVFSKFEFGNVVGADAQSSENRRRENRKRKTEELLRIAEKKKQKMSELKESDPAKAEQVEEQDDWKRALNKSKGLKVKDDVKLLKKTIKRRDNQKKQSRDKWAERNQKIEDKQKKKQDRRTKNIKQHKDAKKQRPAKGKKKKVQGF